VRTTKHDVEMMRFSSRGRVVVPSRLRREYHIEAGAKALVVGTPEGILLKPVSESAIKRARGIARDTPSRGSLVDDWKEHKREELALE
jgi:bifunctional DNA-binding transcriptional regulator/antitoxin component of YhaV-PrlF toxin-antitoxin module